MSTITAVRTIPRRIVGTYLQAARLPVAAAARVTGHAADETWPPALAFEGFQAGVETSLAALVGDEDWLDEGRLRQAKVAQLRRAGELEAVADKHEERAAVEFEQRKQQADKQREAARRQAEAKEQQVKREAEAKERQVKQKAAKKTAAARRTKAAQDEAIARRERSAKAAALEKESEALAATGEALEAERTVEVIDETLAGTKEARKSS